ncbi:MAG: endonuclease/exonuclease/phosphatase family protein [Ignavibacteriales bacterium]|nr:endonuclease/exonuclease/phosphatase family protein [Ignavibacteriales bacterium]
MSDRYRINLLVVLFLWSFNLSAQNQTPLKIMTYNIRLDLASDGDNSWDHRKENFVSMIRFHKPDMVGMQEVLKHQLDFVVRELPEYGWFGVGRDDGKAAGEYMAVLYRKERFDTLRTSTFWCSENPDEPGLGWDAACNRTVTWGKFQDRSDRTEFFFFNTHFDHVGVKARKESAKLLMSKISALSGNDRVVITGDFNSTPSDEPYGIIVDPNAKKRFFDSRTVSRQRPHGPKATFNGFNPTTVSAEPIDYIFVSDRITVLAHGTIAELIDGRFPSDHFPVIADIVFDRKK